MTAKTINTPAIFSVRADAGKSQNFTPVTIKDCPDSMFLKCYHVFFDYVTFPSTKNDF